MHSYTKINDDVEVHGKKSLEGVLGALGVAELMTVSASGHVHSRCWKPKEQLRLLLSVEGSS